MADTIRTLTALLALIPDAISKVRSQGPNDRARLTNQIIRDILVSVNAWVITKNPKESVIACTNVALPAYTYAAGVITAAAPGALAAIDGVTMVAGERLLLKDGAAGLDNGIYEVTTLGTGAVAFVLTRASDMAIGSDAAAAFMVVQEGTVHAEDRMLCTDDTGAAVVGTDALTFVTFQSTDLYATNPANTAAAPVVGTSLLASPGDHAHQHGALADGAALYHDTDDVEPMSVLTGATLTAAVNALERHPRVDLATIAALAAYTRVADVITANGNGAIANIDGTAVVLNSRIVLLSGAAPTDNGIYDVTDLGTAGTPFILTRAADMAAGFAASGSRVYVVRGALNNGKELAVIEPAGTDVINTDGITWVEAHGLISADSSAMHDTDQIDDLSAVGEASLSALLDGMLLSAYRSRVMLETELVFSVGAVNTIAIYDIDWTAAAQVCAAGLWDVLALGNDVDMIGAGNSFDLAGADAVVIAADGNDVSIANCIVRVTAGLLLVHIFGAVAATGASTDPTPAEIRAALDAAFTAGPGLLAGLDTGSLVVAGRCTYARAGGAVVPTYTDPAADSALMTERRNGMLGSQT